MLFGNPSRFAIEAQPEPDSEHPCFVGRSLAGRLRVFVGGQSLGDMSEPRCIFGGLSNHLAEVCSSMDDLWHFSFVGQTERQIFDALDRALFNGQDQPFPAEFNSMSFLTNISESFDELKGFIWSPHPGKLTIAVQRHRSRELVAAHIDASEFCVASEAFTSWLRSQELEKQRQ